MYGFPAGIISPESVLADQNDLFHAFATDFKKNWKYVNFPPQSTYFTFIGTK